MFLFLVLIHNKPGWGCRFPPPLRHRYQHKRAEHIKRTQESFWTNAHWVTPVCAANTMLAHWKCKGPYSDMVFHGMALTTFLFQKTIPPLSRTECVRIMSACCVSHKRHLYIKTQNLPGTPLHVPLHPRHNPATTGV